MSIKKSRLNRLSKIFQPTREVIGEMPESKTEAGEWELPLEPAESGMETVREKSARMTSFYIILMIIGIAFLARLVNVQVTHGQENRLLAEDNRIRSHLTEAPRGSIIDRNGNVLVDNTANYVLRIYPYALPKSSYELDDLIGKIKKEVQIQDDVADKITQARKKSFEPVIIKENLTYDEARKLQVLFGQDSGVEISAVPRRKYDISAGMAHYIGYVGKMSDSNIDAYPNYPQDGSIGKSGVEQSYDAYLRGVPGEEKVEIDSAGRIKRVLKFVPAEIGNTLKLNISKDLQDVLAGNLQKAIDNSGGKSGAAVAMDPRNGDVLSLVSLPDYDLNLFSGKIDAGNYEKLLNDDNHPLLNRAIGGLFPPGSSVKPFVASGGLDSGVISEDTTINTPSEIKIDKWVFPDWKYHGSANVVKAIAESNNIFFYAVGGGYDKIKGLGAEKLAQYLDKFNLDGLTGIDVSGEVKGLVPTPQWKEKVKKENWYIGDTYHMAIGQGYLLVTPIEMAAGVSAIANGGTLYEPRIASEVISAQNGSTIRKIGVSIKDQNFISSDTLQTVREGMRQTITAGSGLSTFGRNFPVEIAGKTGTAQFGTEGKSHAWFTSFAPYNDPKIVIVVFIEGGGEGYQTAAPVAKAAYEWYNNNQDKITL